jgi:hypothetical protein
MSFLWDGSDGEDPAITLSATDIRLLSEALAAYHPQPDLGIIVWPTLKEMQDLQSWLTRWHRAQEKWEERQAGRDPLDENPF